MLLEPNGLPNQDCMNIYLLVHWHIEVRMVFQDKQHHADPDLIYWENLLLLD